MSQQSPSVIIKGIGVYAPENCVTNDALAQTVDTSDAWIRSRTGISERRIAPEGLNTSDMAARAGENAIKNAGLNKEDIDLLIVATMSSDLPFPSTACLVQHKLGLNQVMSFDISAACSGFPYLLQIGKQMVSSGAYRNALIIGAEKMSNVVDWQDRATCVLFGDGAGACLLSQSAEPNTGIIDCILGADGSNTDLLHMPAGGTALPPSQHTLEARQHYLKMNGKEVFKIAVRVMGQTTQAIMSRNHLTPDDIACVVPHQANIRIIDAIVSRLEVPKDRFLINVDRFGNTSAASIPIALEEAYRAKKFKPGDYVLCVAFGAGLTWGATLIRWTQALEK